MYIDTKYFVLLITYYIHTYLKLYRKWNKYRARNKIFKNKTWIFPPWELKNFQKERLFPLLNDFELCSSKEQNNMYWCLSHFVE